MKKFFNREERNNFAMLTILAGHVKGVMMPWAEKVLDKEDLKNLRMANTYLGKFCSGTLGKLDNTLKLTLMKDLRYTEMVFLPKSQSEIVKTRVEKELENELIEVSRESINILAEHSLIGCDPCTCNDKSKCEKRNIYTLLNVETFDSNNEDCPYRIS